VVRLRGSRSKSTEPWGDRIVNSLAQQGGIQRWIDSIGAPKFTPAEWDAHHAKLRASYKDWATRNEELNKACLKRFKREVKPVISGVALGVTAMAVGTYTIVIGGVFFVFVTSLALALAH